MSKIRAFFRWIYDLQPLYFQVVTSLLLGLAVLVLLCWLIVHFAGWFALGATVFVLYCTGLFESVQMSHGLSSWWARRPWADGWYEDDE